MFFDPSVFHGVTNPAVLERINKDLQEAAATISSCISFAGANTAGETIVDWADVQARLFQYAAEAQKIADVLKASLGTIVYTPNPIPLSGDKVNIINPLDAAVALPICHSMEHGSALCGLMGRPYDWPKGHYQAAKNEFPTCKKCLEKLLNRTIKTT